MVVLVAVAGVARAALPPLFLAPWEVDGLVANSRFGSAVASAEDVNSDGYADVLISAPYEGVAGGLPTVHVWTGTVGGLGASPAWSEPCTDCWIFGFGFAVGAAGDVNGDGFGDVVVSDVIDMQGLVPSDGKVFAYHGSATGLEVEPAWTEEPSLEDSLFGLSVRGAGDVNGDGFADVVVGQPQWLGDPPGGLAHVYHGSATGLGADPSWTSAHDDHSDIGGWFGWSVDSAGDVNGDGFDDVVIGAPAWGAGQAMVLHGSATGLEVAPAWSYAGIGDFGTSVAGAGDTNGDGFDDVVVGGPLTSTGGQAFLFLGSATGLDAAPAWKMVSTQVAAQFGAQVASAGDVDGDGLDDVLVAAPYQDAGATADVGRVLLFLGTPTGLTLVPAWSADGSIAGALFGTSVSSAGDIDANGFADFVVGAPNDGDYRGRATVYFGCGTVDGDGDGVGDACDLCAGNDDAADADADGEANGCDVCPAVADPDQTDADGDGAGFACECDDTDPTAHPEANEVCEGEVDENCNGTIDEDCPPPGDTDDTDAPSPGDDDDVSDGGEGGGECSCQAAPGTGSAGWVLALVYGLAVVRRRR